MEFEQNFALCENNCTNNSETDHTQILGAELKHSVAYTVVMIIVYSIVFVLGIIGNSTVILVIGLRPEMRTVTNIFVLNLAVADVFVLLFCLPPTLIASICKSWMLGSFMCWGVAYVQGVSVVASAYSLVAISIDRCQTICNQTLSTGSFSKPRALAIIALIWSLAVFIPIPWAFVFELKVAGTEGHIFCMESWESVEYDIVYFILGNLFCCYIIPFLLIFAANVKIWLKVSRRRVPQASTYASSFSTSVLLVNKIHKKTRRGVGRMLAIVTFTYLITWLPLYILATRLKVSDSFGEVEKVFLQIFAPMAQWLSYGSSCVNPVIYAFFNSTFREMSKSLLPSWMLDIFFGCFWSKRRRRRRRLQIREFALNSRYEHGIRPPVRQSRKNRLRNGCSANAQHSANNQVLNCKRGVSTGKLAIHIETTDILQENGFVKVTAV